MLRACRKSPCRVRHCTPPDSCRVPCTVRLVTRPGPQGAFRPLRSPVGDRAWPRGGRRVLGGSPGCHRKSCQSSLAPCLPPSGGYGALAGTRLEPRGREDGGRACGKRGDGGSSRGSGGAVPGAPQTPRHPRPHSAHPASWPTTSAPEEVSTEAGAALRARSREGAAASEPGDTQLPPEHRPLHPRAAVAPGERGTVVCWRVVCPPPRTQLALP